MRKRLPNRRPCVTHGLWWHGDRYHVSVGFYPDTGEVGEVFAHGPKVGSDSWALLQDASVQLSRTRQDGKTLSEMAAGAIRGPDGEPMSILGVLLDTMQLEAATC